MKTKIKLLVYLFAITIFYTFTSCEKELFENQIVQESKNQNKINYITGAEASKVIENLTSNIQNYNLSNRGGTINYGTIDYSHVMKVVDTIGNKNYTFKVSHPDASFTKFYNIVLQEKIDGQSLIKLFEYNMTEDFAQKLMEGTKTLSNFEGNFNFRLVAWYPTIPVEGSGGDSDGGGNTGGGGDSISGPGGGLSTGGSPCPPCSSGGANAGGGLGSTSGLGGPGGESGPSGGPTGSDGGDSGGSMPCSFTVSTYACSEGVHNGFSPDCIAETPGGTTVTVNCGGNGNKTAQKLFSDPCPCNVSSNNGIGILNPELSEAQFKYDLIRVSLTAHNNFVYLNHDVQNLVYQAISHNSTISEASNVITNAVTFFGALQSNNLFTWFKQLPLEKQKDIIGFLGSKKFNLESRTFAFQAIQHMQQNPNFNFDFSYSYNSPFYIDKSTITDATPEGAKFNFVYKKLMVVPQFKDLFIDMFGETQTINNVKFEIGTIPNVNGQFINAETTKIDNTNFNIKINQMILTNIGDNKATLMEIAKTILHECIHTYLYVKSQNSAINIDNMNVSQALNALYAVGTPQHNFMIQHMLPTMEIILASLLDQLTTETTRNNCVNISEIQVVRDFDSDLPIIPWSWTSYIKNLCQHGLEETTDFVSNFQTSLNNDGETIGNSQYWIFFHYNNYGNIFLEKTIIP